MVDIGTSRAEIAAALKTGQIDALISAAAMGLDLKQRKEGKLLMPASDFVGAFLMNVTYVTKDFAKRIRMACAAS